LTFEDFQLNSDLLDGLNAMGFKTPTPIQQQAIPLILANKDLIASAQTGTGKTAAFLLPILDRIHRSDHRHLNALILAPTRELAQQIDQQIEALAYFLNISSISVYGGGDGITWEQQKKALVTGADIVIATPGRLIGMLGSDAVHFKHLQHLILDEADRMLDMGFYDDILKIISYLPKKRQTLLFSATMPSRIKQLAERILIDPISINISISKPAEGIDQQVYMVHDRQKEPLFKSILTDNDFQSIIVFASTKDKVKQLDMLLRKSKIPAKAFHSDLEQAEREVIMREFKNKQIRIIVGTDILSRGIDVDGIDLVLNFDCPPDPEDYIHRIGRTARAEKLGTAITFINEKDAYKLGKIEKLMEKTIRRMPIPQELGPGPELDISKARPPRPFGSNQSGPRKKNFQKGNSSNRKQGGPPRDKARPHN
jgi:ATP-dependent RNA helicase RhlE